MHKLQVVTNLSFAWATAEEARNLLSSKSNMQFISVEACPLSCSSPSNLGRIYWFCKFLRNTTHDHGNQETVLCAGHDPMTITACAFLLGSYLILEHDKSVEDVTDMFRPISDHFRPFKDPSGPPALSKQLAAMDCWRAIHRAKLNRWLDFSDGEIDTDTAIDLEEYLHYDSPAQGSMHVIIPSRLIGIQCPADLSQLGMECEHTADEAWLDLGGQRFFGPAFYADLLRTDYNVALLVRCGACTSSIGRAEADEHETLNKRSGHYDDDAFVSRGLAMEELALRGYDSATQPVAVPMRDIDRFLTLSLRAPGAVAIHGPAGTALGAGGETLVTALLVQRHGFDGGAALAWLRIAHPPAPPAHLSFSVTSGLPAAAAAALGGPRGCVAGLAAARRFGRCASMPGHWGAGSGEWALERAVSVPEALWHLELNTRAGRQTPP